MKPNLGHRSKTCKVCNQVSLLTAYRLIKRHHRSRVCEACIAAGRGEALHEKSPRLSKEQRTKLLGRLAAGGDEKLLADEFGVTQVTVHTYALNLAKGAKASKCEGAPAANPFISMLSLDHTPRADGALLAHTQTARVAAVVQRQGVRLSPAIAGYLAAFGVR